MEMFRWIISCLLILLITLPDSGSLANIESLECPFTDNFCQWKDQFNNWKIGSYDRPSFGLPFQPTGQGNFIFIESNPDGSELRSEVLDNNVEPFCFHFDYYMFDYKLNQQLTLNLITWKNGEEVIEPVWRREGSQYDDWISVNYYVQPNGQDKMALSFKAISTNIALGSFSVKSGSCDPINLCDFEDLESSCFWTIEPDAKSDYKWVISTGTESGSDFPKTDTTMNTMYGKFLRSPKQEQFVSGQSSLVTNIQLTTNEAKCLSFNLFKTIEQVDTISVNYLFTKGNNRTSSPPIWSSTSVKATQRWMPIKLDLKAEDDFQLVLTLHQVKSAASYPITSDEFIPIHTFDLHSIAIDDLRVDPEPCQNHGSCKFDRDLCGYTIERGPLLFGVGRMDHPEVFSNTPFDPVKNNDLNDLFIYTNTLDPSVSIDYQLLSPSLPSTKLSCLKFSYFIFGGDQWNSDNYFHINMLPVGSESYILWEFEENYNTGRWYQDEIELSSTEPFKIQFAVTGSKIFAAVDDIDFLDGECNRDKSTLPTPGKIILSENFNEFPQNWSIRGSPSSWHYEKYDNYTLQPNKAPPGVISEGFFHFDAAELSEIGIMESKDLRSDNHFNCLSLWIWCSSRSISTFIAQLVDSKTSSERSLFKDYCYQKDEWRSIDTTFTTKGNYRVRLVAGGFDSSIAIGEVRVSDGPCISIRRHHQNCKFDDGLQCNLDILPSPHFNWGIKPGSSLSQPIHDRSTGTEGGRLLALDFAAPSKTKGTSYSYITNLEEGDHLCVSFFYIFNANNARLSVWSTTEDIPEYLAAPLATFSSKTGTDWNQASVQIESVTSETKLVFGGSYSTDTLGVIAIDYIDMSPGECESLNSCDFSRPCSWSSLPIGSTIYVESIKAEYQTRTHWIFGSSDRDIRALAEHRDYSYLPADRRGTGILSSPLIHLPENETNLCLSFAYLHDSDGRIDVLLQQRTGKTFLVQEFGGSRDRNLVEANVTIKLDITLPNEVLIYFVGSEKGFIAIDDIDVDFGECPLPPSPFVCKNGRKLPWTKRCNFEEDCPGGEDEIDCASCDFNEGLCGYTTSGELQWVHEKQMVTLGEKDTEYYSEKEGSLLSPWLQKTAPSCKLEFALNSRYSNDLVLFLDTQHSHEIRFWDTNSHYMPSSSWNLREIDLGRIPHPFRLKFTGHLSDSREQGVHIALDNITMKNCGYGDDVDAGADAFLCRSGQRILQTKVCDHTFDCLDGDDELDCSTIVYTFEQDDARDWTSLGGRFSGEWVLTSGGGDIVSKPSADHTRRLPSGSYFLLRGDREPASLEGPRINSDDICSITFYYYSSTDVRLDVYLTNYQNNVEVGHVEGRTNHEFRKARIDLEKGIIEPPFSIMFTANPPYTYYVAIDDIVIDSKCNYSNSKPDSKWTPTPHPESTTVKPMCDGDQFYCKEDSKCITRKKVCDFTMDCSNGSDEENCGSCDFHDDTMCGWTNEGEALWVTVNSSIIKFEREFPDLLSGDNFLIVAGSPNPEAAILRSPTLGTLSSSCKFKFKYLLEQDSTISIRLQKKGKLVSKRTKELEYIDSGTGWLDGELNLGQLEPDHYIQFVVDVSPSDHIYLPIGLGDFKLVNCDPSKDALPSFNCDFENGQCSWSKEDVKSGGLSWEQIGENDSPSKNRIGFGGISNKGRGHFLYVETTDENSGDFHTTITSPWQTQEDASCFTFWYRMFAEIDVSLNLMLESSDGQTTTLFTRRGTQSYGWIKQSVEIHNFPKFRLMFMAKLSKLTIQNTNEPSDFNIAIDDFKLIQGSCSDYGLTDFETGNLHWVPQGWFITQAQIDGLKDHTSGTSSGHYLRSQSNGASILELPPSSSHSIDSCLTFWTHSTSHSEPILTVNLVKNDVTVSSKTFQNQDLSSSLWEYHRWTVFLGDGFGLKIVGQIDDQRDIIALDDILIFDSPCETDGNCNFNHDSCGWENDGSVLWLRSSGVPPSLDSVSLGNETEFQERGWYMFVQKKDIVSDYAALRSGIFSTESDMCLSFMYLSTSTHPQNSVVELSINLEDLTSGSTIGVDSVPTDGSSTWRRYEKTIEYPPQLFKIIINALSAPNDDGDIAIDDISIRIGRCSN